MSRLSRPHRRKLRAIVARLAGPVFADRMLWLIPGRYPFGRVFSVRKTATGLRARILMPETHCGVLTVEAES